jgi:hypothetical protein
MKRFQPALMPLAPSALPISDPEQAWALILKHFPELPAWPRLPHRSFLEKAELQLSEGFPGVVFEGDHIYVDGVWESDPALDRLYISYLGNNVEHGRISRQYASGLDLLRTEHVRLPAQTVALAGRVLGPLSWGASVNEQDGKPILRNEVMLDAVAKHLCLKAAWQESVLRAQAPVTITLVDEPLLTREALENLPFDKERAILLLEDVLAGLTGLRGVHCPWPLDPAVLSTSANVLSLDISSGARRVPGPDGDLGLLREFVARGGVLVWCITPEANRVEGESAVKLADRLQTWLDAVAAGESILDAVIAASMVSPAPALDKLDAVAAERAMTLTVEVSEILQTRYG